MSAIDFPTFLILWNKLQGQATPRTHLRLAAWIEARWQAGDKRLLVMAFRGFGKSTIIGVFCTWILWRDPNLRILVLAADLALARKMVRNVKRIIEKHPLTRGLKPAKSDQWASDCFTLKRSKELRDPTMLAKGITTNLTGTRADIVICDDVEVPKTSDTAGKREELRERLRELDYILTSGGTMIYIGTPHHWETIYADKKTAGKVDIFLNGFARIVIPLVNAKGGSEWPERFSREDIERIECSTGPSQFASQMMCQPVNLADGCFDTDNLNIYDEDVVYSESARQPVLTIGDRKMVSAAAWWDPAFGRVGGDKSVVAIVYTDEDGHYWLHHLQAILTTPYGAVPEAEQQCIKVAEMMENYFVPQIAVETNGIGQFLPGNLRKTLGDFGLGTSIIEVTSRKPKNIRIREAFEVVLASRALHVHRTALANSFLRELKEWSPHKRDQPDDTLDAVAGALSMQPVRIKRSYATRKKQEWTGAGKMQKARTILND